MKHHYWLKRTIPRKFVVLEPEQYKIRIIAPIVTPILLKVYVALSGKTMTFRLSAKGKKEPKVMTIQSLHQCEIVWEK